jgi:hypothetical protein
MIFIAILGSVDKASDQTMSAVLLFISNSFFAIGWLAMAGYM